MNKGRNDGRRLKLVTLLVSVALPLSATWPAAAIGAESHPEMATPELKKGPHGGRMLVGDGGFALEVTIYEPGIPPQSRVYPYLNGEPLAPAEVKLEMELHRFDRVDPIRYVGQGDFLLGDKVVEEPHSFDVKVRASFKGREYSWQYESYEGRVEISAENAKLSGIGLERVESRKLVERIPVLGQVGFNQDRVQHISARYPGAVTWISKGVGDYVKRGETIAVLMGTASLAEFKIQAAVSGHVVEKRISVGEVVSAGQTILKIADLSTVWVDFIVYHGDIPRVERRQSVRILPENGIDDTPGTIAYISPVGEGRSQSVTARVVLANPSGNLRPGLFVKGEIEVDAIDARTVVRREAIQTFRDWTVVFRNRGTLYEIAVVELGLADGDYVQVLSGLSPGESYVAKNSFVVKADVGKSGASHDH